MSSLPFVIWTLQRTGGTNLTDRLVDMAGLPVTQHEPFNRERIHGHLANAWIDQRDDAALAAGMAQVCANPSVLKHCVEMVPVEVSLALAWASSQAGARHVFLFRRQALGRLLSLHFARSTGIWGPIPKKLVTEQTASVQSMALPVDALLTHERRCAQLLTTAWESLLALGQRPMALAFEDLYGDDVSPLSLRRRMAALLTHVGLTPDDVSVSSLCDALQRKGNQGTRDLYGGLPGREALEQGLAKTPVFVPSPWLSWWQVERADPRPEVRLATVDEDARWWAAGDALGGLVVLSPGVTSGWKLVWRGRDGAFTDVPWGYESSWAAQAHADCPQASHARFALPPGCLSAGSGTLCLQDPQGGPAVPVLSLTRRPPAPQVWLAAVKRLQAKPELAALPLLVGLRRLEPGLRPSEETPDWQAARTWLAERLLGVATPVASVAAE